MAESRLWILTHAKSTKGEKTMNSIKALCKSRIGNAFWIGLFLFAWALVVSVPVNAAGDFNDDSSDDLILGESSALLANSDPDGDGVPDIDDNCTQTFNPSQTDADGDGFGNACDPDLNNNCVVNVADLGLLRSAFFSADPVADFNGDGDVNVLDLGVMKLFFFEPPGPSGLATACDPTGPAAENIVALHNRRSPQYDKHCASCHADIHTGQSLDPMIPDAHVAMLPFAPGRTNSDKQCAWCHRSVDLVQAAGSAFTLENNLRKRVDARTCTLCHGPAGPGKQFYQVSLPALQLDGTELYDLFCSGCHRVLADSQVTGDSAAEIQEKIDGNEGGMGPLGVLSADQIQAIAAALAQ